jgi:hypothetical protein
MNASLGASRRAQQGRDAREIEIRIIVNDARSLRCIALGRAEDDRCGFGIANLSQIPRIRQESDGFGAGVVEGCDAANADFRIPDELAAETLDDLAQAVCG